MRDDILRPIYEASFVKRVFVSWSVNGRISKEEGRELKN